ncbi:MAG: hypothetical protein VXY56_01530, partial [Pseudomonadota bacterium]|nr:hypothetical protein [Pseudomonadota bacterium]
MDEFVLALRRNDHASMVACASSQTFWETAPSKAFDLALLSQNTRVLDQAIVHKVAIPPLARVLAILSRTKSVPTLEWVLDKCQDPKDQSEHFVPVIDSLKIFWSIPILLKHDAVDPFVHDNLLFKAVIVADEPDIFAEMLRATKVEESDDPRSALPSEQVLSHPISLVELARISPVSKGNVPSDIIATILCHSRSDCLCKFAEHYPVYSHKACHVKGGLFRYIDTTNQEFVDLLLTVDILPPNDMT